MRYCDLRPGDMIIARNVRFFLVKTVPMRSTPGGREMLWLYVGHDGGIELVTEHVHGHWRPLGFEVLRAHGDEG